MKKTESGASNEPEVKGTDESRRDFMRKAGKLAVYTPPAMMLLMQPGKESFASSPGMNAFPCGPSQCDNGEYTGNSAEVKVDIIGD